MNLKIDIREKELIYKIENLIKNIPAFKDIKLSTDALPLGDIIIFNENKENIIIERKTINDLSASIKDGRYEEQSYRLNGINHPNHNIIYLIEGKVNQSNSFNKVDSITIYSAIFSILYYKGFSILRSFDIDESAFIICNMVIKLIRMKDKKPYYSLENLNKTEVLQQEEINIQQEEINKSKEYCKVVKKVKKDNITIDNIGEIMLCQIPGISSNSAIAILNKFKTISNLIKNINENENCLNEIQTMDGNKKFRKISKTIIANLIKFLK